MGTTVMLRWEPCETYDADHECELGTCVHCGWPGDDHTEPNRAGGYAHAA